MQMMTRMLRLLFVGLLLTIPFSGFAQNTIYGDVNGDDEVTIADVNAVISVILGESMIDRGLVGTWISEYGVNSHGRYDILEHDVVSFAFNEDHTGRYTYYSPYGLEYTDLYWETSCGRLYIRYSDGFFDNLCYWIDDSGYLLLALDVQFTIYTAYRPVTESDMNTTGSNGTSHHISRAVKVRP